MFLSHFDSKAWKVLERTLSYYLSFFLRPKHFLKSSQAMIDTRNGSFVPHSLCCEVGRLYSIVSQKNWCYESQKTRWRKFQLYDIFLYTGCLTLDVGQRWSRRIFGAVRKSYDLGHRAVSWALNIKNNAQGFSPSTTYPPASSGRLVKSA